MLYLTTFFLRKYGELLIGYRKAKASTYEYLAP